MFLLSINQSIITRIDPPPTPEMKWLLPYFKYCIFILPYTIELQWIINNCVTNFVCLSLFCRFGGLGLGRWPTQNSHAESSAVLDRMPSSVILWCMPNRLLADLCGIWLKWSSLLWSVNFNTSEFSVPNSHNKSGPWPWSDNGGGHPPKNEVWRWACKYIVQSAQDGTTGLNWN